mmetsp:Transcript_77306/g.160772  ORF Transcript_77306/g.160772 Transcript_77306/m.160772 type:complete len:181 (-) Transcript_77306:26-568(-)
MDTPRVDTATAQRHEALVTTLRTTQAIPGYRGHVPLSRNVVGCTFSDLVKTAQSLDGSKESIGNEAWMRTGTVQAASTIILRGNGQRMDLQELMSSTHNQQPWTMRPSPRKTSEVSHAQRRTAPGHEVVKSSPRRINPAELEAAGCHSVCTKMESWRREAYQQEKNHLIQNRETFAAILR